jgi:hypothetical protein
MNIDPNIAVAIASGVWIPAFVLALLWKAYTAVRTFNRKRRHRIARGLIKL